jgi:hypothetical protein
LGKIKNTFPFYPTIEKHISREDYERLGVEDLVEWGEKLTK